MISPVYKLVLYSELSGYVSVSAKWPEMDKISLVLYLTTMCGIYLSVLVTLHTKSVKIKLHCYQISKFTKTNVIDEINTVFL